MDSSAISMPTFSREELGLFLQFLNNTFVTGVRRRLTIDSKLGLLGNDMNAEHVIKPTKESPGWHKRILKYSWSLCKQYASTVYRSYGAMAS